MKRTLTAFCVAAGVMAASASAVAHHGAATFDTGKKLVLEGVVTEWVWANPHCFLKFDVKEKDGTTRNWTVETSNPPDMVNRGWTRRSFKAGEQVTVTVEPVKSGNPVGRVLEVAFPDGRVLSARGPAPAAGREGAPPQ
jgi:uncharacterized protein DUF6152